MTAWHRHVVIERTLQPGEVEPATWYDGTKTLSDLLVEVDAVTLRRLVCREAQHPVWIVADPGLQDRLNVDVQIDSTVHCWLVNEQNECKFTWKACTI